VILVETTLCGHRMPSVGYPMTAEPFHQGCNYLVVKERLVRTESATSNGGVSVGTHSVKRTSVCRRRTFAGKAIRNTATTNNQRSPKWACV